MIDTDFAKKIAILTDSELDRQISAAYDSAYIESYGRNYGAHADAIQEYEMLEREWKRRRAASAQNRTP